VRYFDPILLESREWPPAEFGVTPELVEAMPRQVADLYGRMPDLVDKELGLLDITSRICKLYKSHENRNIGQGEEALLSGNFPPLLLSYFASLNGWTEFMGLVLLSGFCPCALVGLSPSELLERNMPEQKMDGIYEKWYGGRYAEKWELPGHPPAKWILEQVSCDKNPSLLRLDGLTLSKTMMAETYVLMRHLPPIKDYDANIYGKLFENSHRKLNIQRLKLIERKDAREKELIEYFEADTHGQLLQQLHTGINILLLKWIEYRGANDWQVPKGKNVLRLPPSEFVRFAEKIKFDIPWLGFAKAHFPHLLPEESKGTIESERDSLKAMVDKTGTLGKRAESTYLNIIGAMLDLMLSKSPGGQPYSTFVSQAAIISALLAHHEGKSGISARTLEEKFAAAKRSLTTT